MKDDQVPDFGYIWARRSRVFNIYFDGRAVASCPNGRHSHDWLDEKIISVYGARDRRRYLLPRTQQAIKVAVKAHAVRAKKLGLPGEFCAEEWIDFCCHFGGLCLRCNSAKIPIIDHVIPLSCGGPNLIVNVQPLCKSCNSHKSNKWTDYRNAEQLEQFLLRYKR